jgi:hypothetical protein
MIRRRIPTLRLRRAAIALVLVLAQAVSAFGFPLVRSRAASPCGCTTPCGNSPENCCCKTSHPVAAAPVPAKPAACDRCGGEPGACCHTLANLAPKPAGCAKCRAKSAQCPSESPTTADADDSSPTVTWVAGFKARQCRGDSPLGLLAELPSVPPATTHPITLPVPVGVLSITDAFSTSRFAAPLDPPPRCG